MYSLKRTIAKSFVFMAVLVGVTAQSHAMKDPDVVVKETVDAMVAQLQNNSELYKSNNQALYDMLDEVLIPVLHIDRLSDLILGKRFARSSSDEQKTAFAGEFKTFLLQSYATALLKASGEEKVAYEPVSLKPDQDKVKVKAILTSSSGEQYPIILSMSNRSDTQWRAYNIEVAGVNFIRSYRSSFAQTLDEGGIDGLIADLRAKNTQ